MKDVEDGKLLNRHPIISPYINHFKGIYGKKIRLFTRSI